MVSEILIHIVSESDWPVALSTAALAFIAWHQIRADERQRILDKARPLRRIHRMHAGSSHVNVDDNLSERDLEEEGHA